MVTDPTILMETILLDLPILVELNHHHTVRVTIPTVTSLMRHGVQVEMEHSMETVEHEDVKASLLSMNSTK